MKSLKKIKMQSWFYSRWANLWSWLGSCEAPNLYSDTFNKTERSDYWPMWMFRGEFKVQHHNDPTWVFPTTEGERARYRQINHWICRLGSLLLGEMLGINLRMDGEERQPLNQRTSKHILNFVGMTRLIHHSRCPDKSDTWEAFMHLTWRLQKVSST